MKGKLLTAEAARTYTLAGNATVTLKSLKTEKHLTFKVRATNFVDKEGQDADPPSKWFVSVLADGDQYIYVGFIDNRGFRLTAKSRYNANSAPYQVFNYFYQHVIVGGRIPEQLEVRHEGQCGRCGRALTVPESIDSGIGPVCAGRMLLC